MALSFSDAGAFGTWIRTIISGDVTIIANPSTLSGTTINDTIINNNNYDAVIVYSIIPSTTICNGPPATLTVIVAGNSTTISCPNSNFSNGSFSNWSGCSGLWCDQSGPGSTRCTNPFTPYNPPCNNPNQPWYNTPVGGHFSIQTPGTDPCIPALQKVFPGEMYAALIGNRVCSGGGGYIDQLTYQITYDPSNSLFFYRSAIVLANITDPTHNTPDKRPRFTIEIRDHITGTVIDPICGAFDLFPGDGVTAWNNGPNNFVWKDWSTVGLDISQLTGIIPGQVLDVVFTVHGCSYTAHTGYAYISASCNNLPVSIAGCTGTNSIQLTGPAGFASYQWTGPYCATCSPSNQNGQSITINNALPGWQYKLQLTSFYNNCQITDIWSTLQFTQITPDFEPLIGCVGSPSNFIDQSEINQNPTNERVWDFGDGTATVTVTTGNVAHTYTSPGIYVVSLTRTSTDPCSATKTMTISVTFVPAEFGEPVTPAKSIWSGDIVAIPLTVTPTTTTAYWTTSVVAGTVSITTNPQNPAITTSINDIIYNHGTTPAIVVYTIYPGSIYCHGVPSTCTVTVYPANNPGAVSINTDGNDPHPSSMLDIKSTDRGFLIPRITSTNRDLIPSPAIGLLIYNTTTGRFNFFNGSFWNQINVANAYTMVGKNRPGGGVSINTSPNHIADSSSILDVDNSTRGLLIPRTTPNLITSPANGLIIYNSSTNLFNYFNGTEWIALCGVQTGNPPPLGNQVPQGVSIKQDNSPPHHSAILDVDAIGKGVLIPRMNNYQRDAILATNGLLLYNTTSGQFQFCDGTQWLSLAEAVPVSLSINASVNSICHGTQVVFTAIPVNPGTSPIYQWKVNNTLSGTNSPTFSYAPSNNDVVTCQMTSNINCASGNPSLSNAITMTVFSPPFSPVAGNHSASLTQIIWSWNQVPNATGYKWNSVNDFNTATDMGMATTKNETGLSCNTTYLRYVWSYNACGHTTPSTLTQTTSSNPPSNPTSGSHVAGLTQITWNWSVVQGATGYKWNTVNNYSTATDIGTATSTVESGLVCNTNYIRYVWAYGPCGQSAATVLTKSTTSDTILSPLAGNHVTTQNQITWNWNPVQGASGYKWNTLNDFVTATDLGTASSTTESNLTCSNFYTRYLWAYNFCGNSSATTLITQTSSCPGYPSVITSGTTTITQTTAISGGNVLSDGGSIVLFRGVCWDTAAIPTINDPHTTDGDGLGSFTSNLTGLAANTLYFVRAYALNLNATAYGNEVTFATQPSISTNTVSGITQTAAVCGGNIATGGGAAILGRGVCWSTNPNPTLANSYTSDGTGPGTYTSQLTGLTTLTAYYVRSYATNLSGTTYGNERTFTTIANLPQVTTDSVYYITPTAAFSGGNVISNGGATVTQRGVCWSTSPNPTITNNKTTNGSGNGTFTSNLTGLTPNTVFHVRAYATNSSGTAYGNDVTFSTLLNPTIPVVSTTAMNNITFNSAVSGGNVLSDGGSNVLFRGVCWNTSPNPTISNSKTTNGSGIGLFVSLVNSLDTGTVYYLRAYAMNNVGIAYGSEMTFATLSGIVNIATTTVTSINVSSAVSGGIITSDGGASVTTRGVCWSTMPSPTIADNKTIDGNGIGIYSSAIGGLSSNTTYFVRAYATSYFGTFYGNEVIFTTMTNWICSGVYTANHITGNVAPANKMVSYGIVTNIPGEPTKCWITSNLGASQQAITVNDASESSAGWYWQFNRKQGYMHDGTTRTPNSTWISNISENSDWQASNDPCNLELGSAWHVPTYIEWFNVENTGGWNNWNGPWNSNLKLHAAGNLVFSDGSLNNRGSTGYYWSNTQNNSVYGWYLYFYSGYCYMITNNKAYGFTLRCLRDLGTP